jgi:hypothetical protein
VSLPVPLFLSGDVCGLAPALARRQGDPALSYRVFVANGPNLRKRDEDLAVAALAHGNSRTAIGSEDPRRLSRSQASNELSRDWFVCLRASGLEVLIGRFVELAAPVVTSILQRLERKTLVGVSGASGATNGVAFIPTQGNLHSLMDLLGRAAVGGGEASDEVVPILPLPSIRSDAA